MNQQEMNLLNKKIIDSLKSVQADTPFDKDSIFINKLIKFLDKNEMPENFNNLYAFLKSVDIKHPELSIFLKINLGIDFIDMIKDVNLLQNFIKSKCSSLVSIIPKLDKIIVEICNFAFLKNIGDPESTKTQTRFLAKDKRWKSRSTKEPQQIYRKSSVKRNIVLLENNIDSFIHNSGSIEKLYNELLVKKKYFDEINCNSMSKEIEASAIKVKENLSYKKYGFYRVSISSIMNIASSIFDFNYAEILPITDKNYFCNKSSASDIIHLCETFFGKNYGIFDHYAEIKFEGISSSYLVGEIDQKTYFLGIVS
jgi:hypothetical protein